MTIVIYINVKDTENIIIIMLMIINFNNNLVYFILYYDYKKMQDTQIMCRCAIGLNNIVIS